MLFGLDLRFVFILRKQRWMIRHVTLNVFASLYVYILSWVSEEVGKKLRDCATFDESRAVSQFFPKFDDVEPKKLRDPPR